ncbi:hypothetical protein [Kitasatospora sp. NPDC089509]|uniref:hypothetical protein n=1 Tax=Kitasatospora sp. NPDC089509 TaxID=3364079 RepID=UPI003804E6DB
MDGFESAEDALAGSGPSVTVTVCDSHRGAAEAWLEDFHRLLRAYENVGQRCGWVHDFREPEVVLRAHVDAWLGRLGGLDLADHDGWAAYLSAAHERLCTLHGLEPGHLKDDGAVAWVGMAALEAARGRLRAALYYLGHAEALAGMGLMVGSPSACC